VKPKKTGRIYQTKSFSLPPDLLKFVSERAKALGANESDYVQKLIRHDLEENTLADIMRKSAKALTVAA
jgi:hypothetical protein